MAQPPRSIAEGLQAHIDELARLQTRMRLGQTDIAADIRRVCADIGALFPPPAPRPVNPPVAVTATGMWW